MRLRRKKFIAWLKTKKPDEVVGIAQDNCGCPLANFYHDASGGCDVSIFQNGYGTYSIDRGYVKRPLPRWAHNFAFEVDTDANGDISAARALEIMEG